MIVDCSDSLNNLKMSGYNRQGNRGNRIKYTNVGSQTDWKPKIDGSMDGVSCSQNHESSVTRESVVEDVDSGMKNLKLIPNLIDRDDNSKKAEKYGDNFQKDDNRRLNYPLFDICPKRVSSVTSVIKLKAPLHMMNKEKRNQIKQSMKGQNTIILRPGMVLMKGYISSHDQISIVKTCRELGIRDGGFYQPGYSGGTKLHLKMMCLGKNWDPESHMYTELRPFDKSKPPEIPEKFHDMVRKAIQDSNEFIRGKIGSSDEGKLIPSMSPDICIVNFYTKSGRLGLHQDKDESETSLKKGLPVVSFSLGDSAEFLYGETRAIDEADKVILESGDVLIFGGKSRLIYHGVTSILPDTAPASLIEATNMCPGRLNLTFRMFSQNDKSSVTGESVVKGLASDVKKLKQIPVSLDDDDNCKKVKQFGDKSQKGDGNNHHAFDICPKKVSSVIKLKAPLHVTNREKRNQIKQSMKGQNIIILGPGMVLMKGYISSDDQISIVKNCRELGIGDGGFYQPGYSGGTKLHLKMMCLGKNWDPESHMYTELRPFDNSKPPAIPEKFHDMVKKAIQDSNDFIRGNIGRSDAGKLIPSMSPDICIVNFYSKSGRLGLHQDKDESETSLKKGLPVVSFSLGDSAEFLYGETRAIDEAEKVILESGDVLIFGGKSRLIYHGVTSIIPDTAPASLIQATDMCPGRLNLTFRMF